MTHTRYASNILQAVGLAQFLSSRHFPFTVNDLADDLGLSDSSARRILLTVETVGWVARTDEKRVSEDAVGGWAQRYRSLIRIRRVPNGG